MRAHYNGKIPRNPFAQFHISPNCKEREFLTEEELKAVVTHEFDDDSLAFVRDIFVFVCFTALSFIDVKELTTDNIVDINGDKLNASFKSIKGRSSESHQACMDGRVVTELAEGKTA